MRLVGFVLLRTGFVMICAALLGGLAVAVYALVTGLDGVLHGDIVGEKETAKRLILYPIGAGVAGSFLALPGLLLSYLGGSALERDRDDSARST